MKKRFVFSILLCIAMAAVVYFIVFLRYDIFEQIDNSLFYMYMETAPKRLDAFIEAVLLTAVFLTVWILVSATKRNISFVIPMIAVSIYCNICLILYKEGIVKLGIVESFLTILLSYITAVLSNCFKQKREKKTQEISIDSLLLLGSRLLQEEELKDFNEYIDLLIKDIECSGRIKILKAFAKAGDEEVKGLSETSIDNGFSITYNSGIQPHRYKVLLRLPEITDKNAEPIYLLIGMDKKMNVPIIKSTMKLFTAAYILFNVSKDAKEKAGLFLNLIQSMMSAIDAKDPITSGHSQRVADMSGKLAEWMGLSRHMVEQVRFSGMIHDLGKIGIPDSILGKPAPLSEKEFEIMKKHPLVGGEIISAVKLPDEILDGILYHHERLDGKGYPYMAASEEIPITARILKVVDVYDALTSERQYKKAWTVEKTLNHLYTGKGTEFDEAIVDVFIEHLKPKGYVPSLLMDEAACIEDINDRHHRFYKICLSMKYFITQNKVRIASCPEKAWNSFMIDKLCRNGFFGMEWYSGYNTGGFMDCIPYVLFSQDEKIFFVLKGREMVSYIYFYFVKGFLTGGFIEADEGYISAIKEGIFERRVDAGDFELYNEGKLDVLFGKTIVAFLR